MRTTGVEFVTVVDKYTETVRYWDDETYKRKTAYFFCGETEETHYILFECEYALYKKLRIGGRYKVSVNDITQYGGDCRALKVEFLR